ncbi:MAG: hypothetical protein BM556_16685 [Bacteriovorax sp. MedPE-SWde]|nr:MAG: hypothetical protein BM556_16685 [Bacteriovorax sp. MedPE-SWde]
MKVAFAILCLFFISFAFQSHARDLNIREKSVLLNFDKTVKVKTYVEHNISVSDLPLSQYLSYKVLKNSCRPVIASIAKIEGADEEYKDSSEKLASMMNVCSQGVIGLTNLYIDQQQ